MGECLMKSDDNKRVLYFDATNIYGHSMSQPIPYDETEMWHGPRVLHMNKLEEISNTPDDSDIGDFIDVDIRYSNNINEKTKNFYFVLKLTFFLMINIMIIWKR